MNIEIFIEEANNQIFNDDRLSLVYFRINEVYWLISYFYYVSPPRSTVD